MTEKTIRELYLDNEILKIGEKINESLEIIDRRSNYIVCSTDTGDTIKMFVAEAYERTKQTIDESQKKLFGQLYEGFSYKGYRPLNFTQDITDKFKILVETTTDPYCLLHAIKAVDRILGKTATSDIISQGKKHLETLGVLDEHAYINACVPVQEEIKPKPMKGMGGKIQKYFDDNYVGNEEKKEEKKKTLKEMSDFLAEDIKEYSKELDSLEKDHSELSKLADKVDDLEDIAHHYSEDELRFTEPLEESLSREARIKKKIDFLRSAPKRERARAMALHRISSNTKVVSKARKAAIELIKEKIAKKPLNKLSLPEKERLEDLIKKRPELIKRLATKLVPKIKQIERDRVYFSGKKKDE